MLVAVQQPFGLGIQRLDGFRGLFGGCGVRKRGDLRAELFNARDQLSMALPGRNTNKLKLVGMLAQDIKGAGANTARRTK